MLLSSLLLATATVAQTPPPATSSGPPAPARLPFVVVPRSQPNLCLDVRSAQWQDGTAVQVWECNGSVAQIVLNGTTIEKYVPQHIDWPAGWQPSDWVPGTPWQGWCLDAGIAPRDGSKVKIWRCYPGLLQQTWVWNGRAWRIAGTDLCLDVTDGGFWGGNQLQVWTCDSRNPNQAWDYRRTQW